MSNTLSTLLWNISQAQESINMLEKQLEEAKAKHKENLTIVLNEPKLDEVLLGNGIAHGGKLYRKTPTLETMDNEPEDQDLHLCVTKYNEPEQVYSLDIKFGGEE